MSTLVSLIIIAAIGGLSIALQAQFMGVVDKQLGTLESVFLTYGSGGLLIGLVMLLMKGGNLGSIQGIPWYGLFAGILGLIIVGSIGYSTARLGLVTALTIIVAAQFTAGAFMDHFGILGAELRPLDLTRITGIGFLFLGAWLVVR